MTGADSRDVRFSDENTFRAHKSRLGGWLVIVGSPKGAILGQRLPNYGTAVRYLYQVYRGRDD